MSNKHFIDDKYENVPITGIIILVAIIIITAIGFWNGMRTILERLF